MTAAWWALTGPLEPLPVVRPGTLVALLDGARMRTAEAVLAEFSRALAFPEWFGHNWNALDDCLADLGWLPGADGWLIVVEDAGQVLADDAPGVFGLLLDVLARAGESWSRPVAEGAAWDRPARDLRAVLRCASSGQAGELADRAEAGGADLARGALPR